jgi:hypothetical protein
VLSVLSVCGNPDMQWWRSLRFYSGATFSLNQVSAFFEKHKSHMLCHVQIQKVSPLAGRDECETLKNPPQKGDSGLAEDFLLGHFGTSRPSRPPRNQ